MRDDRQHLASIVKHPSDVRRVEAVLPRIMTVTQERKDKDGGGEGRIGWDAPCVQIQAQHLSVPVVRAGGLR